MKFLNGDNPGSDVFVIKCKSKNSSLFNDIKNKRIYIEAIKIRISLTEKRLPTLLTLSKFISTIDSLTFDVVKKILRAKKTNEDHSKKKHNISFGLLHLKISTFLISF